MLLGVAIVVVVVVAVVAVVVEMHDTAASRTLILP
jgi:hypothetical protein